MTMVRFDEALDVAIKAIRAQLGGRTARITLVRDVAGQLTAALDDGAIADDEWGALANTLHERLGPFSPGPQRVLLRNSDLIDEQDVLNSPDRVPVPDAEDTWLVDRLLTNQDWLRKPRLVRSPLPLAVAFSLKGGVGRSTALAALAWHLARRGKKVLAIDLDLEAPGLGSLLLDELPDYGLVDWLVEALVGQPDSIFLQDCLARSAVANDSTGIVQVMPAFGRRTRDYVTKVGRVFLPGLLPDGTEQGLAEKLATLVRLFGEQDESPDVVLLDARAGLQDIGAAAVTQLGAEVFLFARDEPQSWHAYRLLLEHLAKSKGVTYGMPDEDLRWRLKMVAAQIDKTEGALANWIEASYDTWSALYDDESKTPGDGPSAQIFARDDFNAPHYPLPVYFDGGLRGVALADSAERPPWSVVEATFGAFLVAATARLLPEGDGGPGAGTVRTR
jgi:cellulose biosynthesis protein BcsQ